MKRERNIDRSLIWRVALSIIGVWPLAGCACQGVLLEPREGDQEYVLVACTRDLFPGLVFTDKTYIEANRRALQLVKKYFDLNGCEVTGLASVADRQSSIPIRCR